MKKSNITFNVIINFLYEIILIITPFITAPYISRVLGSYGVGVTSYSKSLVMYFTMFASLGVASYGKREIGRNRDNKTEYSKTFWEIEILVSISSFICLLVWLFFSFAYQEYTGFLIILSFNIISVAFNISWLFFGLEKYVYTVSINILFKIIDIFAIFFLVKNSDDIAIYIAISSISVILSNLSMWVFAPKVLAKAKPDFSKIKIHLKETWIYFIPTISTTLYMVIDKTLIGIICNNPSENGYYEQATNIINMVRVAAYSSINSVMNSRTNYLYKINDFGSIKRLTRSSFHITSFLSIGACFGIIGVSSTFIPLFLGNDFNRTIYLLYILAFIIPTMCTSDSIGALYYTPSGRRKQSTKYLIVGIILNVILNVFLIPFIGSFGAALSSLIGELIITFLYVFKCNGFLSFAEILKYFWKKIIAGFFLVFICSLTGYLLRALNINSIFIFFAQLFSGLMTYLLILYVLKDNSFQYFITFLMKKRIIFNKGGVK